MRYSTCRFCTSFGSHRVQPSPSGQTPRHSRHSPTKVRLQRAKHPYEYDYYGLSGEAAA